MCIIIVICISAFKTHQFGRGVVKVTVLRLNQRSGRKRWLRTGFCLTGVDWSVSGVVLISDIAKTPNEALDNDSKTVTILYLAQVGLKCVGHDSEEWLGKKASIWLKEDGNTRVAMVTFKRDRSWLKDDSSMRDKDGDQRQHREGGKYARVCVLEWDRRGKLAIKCWLNKQGGIWDVCAVAVINLFPSTATLQRFHYWSITAALGTWTRDPRL